MESWFYRSEEIRMKKKQEQSAFIPIPIILSKLHSLNPEVLVAQWIALLTSDPDIAGSNPAEDDFGFRRFSLFRKFTLLYQKPLCFMQKKIQMTDGKISSEQPKIYRAKKEHWKL